MRTNYVLVDFENVQPELLDALDHDYFKLMIFVGATQIKLSFDIAAAVQKLGERAKYIKISGNGPNALDFHIAYYIGLLANSDPTAYFHVISKDKGFDPLIQHLKSQNIFAKRTADIANIPLVKSVNTKTASEKIAIILAKLSSTSSKPKTVRTLSSTVAALFQNQLPEEEILVLLKELQDIGKILIVGNKISYCDTE